MAEVGDAEYLLGKLPFLRLERPPGHLAGQRPPAERIVRHGCHDVDVPAGCRKLLDHGGPSALGRALFRPVGVGQQRYPKALGLRPLWCAVNEVVAHV